MSAWGQGHGRGEADMTAPGPGHIASPKGAAVYFDDPIYGIRVPQRFTVQIGLRHHHILFDANKIDLIQPIPSDYNPIHPGNGQSEVVLTLKPGTHMLQLLMGDHVHMPHVPSVMSKKMTLHVR